MARHSTSVPSLRKADANDSHRPVSRSPAQARPSFDARQRTIFARIARCDRDHALPAPATQPPADPASVRLVHEFDAVIAGGGIAGSSTAAALARTGLRVLVCESGLPDERRLAGELFHPPAVANLDRLGLLTPELRSTAMLSYGFALFRGPTDPGTVLAYHEVPHGHAYGLATEHSFLTRQLLSAAAAQPNVHVWEGARVLAADARPHGTYVNVIRNGQPERVACRLLVSAEGRASKLRKQAGIIAEPSATHRLIGWRIRHASLPFPGFGHIFLGGPATALAYQIAPDEARVMFEIPASGPLEVPTATLASLPDSLRTEVEQVMGRERSAVAKVVTLAPTRAVASGFAVVGDAGGCSHPLTASGISACVRDAMLLGETLADEQVTVAPSRLDRALVRYETGRRRAVRTRVLLASALRDALYRPEPDMQVLREALFDYWHRSPRGRQTSIGLLTTQHDDTTTLLREYAGISLRALNVMRARGGDDIAVVPALAGLARRNAGYLADAVPRPAELLTRFRPLPRRHDHAAV
ncbi:MAG: FAD-dependent monooxygenase [Myxococcales bacterium FL481]|nr:MAG: FAD-dependent monooxygenase [Myxococcales bacterium FL481]